MPIPRALSAIAVAIAFVTAPAVASAAPGAKPKIAAGGHHPGLRADEPRSAPDPARPGKKGAQSIGAPNSGKLVGAARLRGSPYLKQRKDAHSWGLPELVKLLHRAAAKVARKHPRSVMLVGDLSGRTGGHIDGHGSHQSGRDADVGFYVMNSKGKPLPTKRFIAFDGAGNARDVPGARFDDARNWTLVEALLKDDKANVRYLFVTNALRARLLAQAAKKHAPKEIVERAAAAMMSPPDADQHDDHFHVRIACPASMRGTCVEEAVVRGAPAEDKPAQADGQEDSKAP
jgi:penicillin-insensitive murein endopeptidase